jgi:CheY-like chemotaxis protein
LHSSFACLKRLDTRERGAAVILVVDDHADAGATLARLLRRVGLHGESVTNGTAALAVLDAVRPEAVILDHHMPVMTGLDVLRRIRETPALDGLPVLMYSADADPRDVEEARRLGAADWVTKGEGDSGDVLADIARAMKAAANPVALASALSVRTE